MQLPYIRYEILLWSQQLLHDMVFDIVFDFIQSESQNLSACVVSVLVPKLLTCLLLLCV